MPFTFSHPAAVLPLRRLRYLDFTALVIGSVVPDFGYFIPGAQGAHFAHTLPAGILACLPSGLFLLAWVCFLRVPVCHLLPSPHRDVLLPLARRSPAWNMRDLWIACLSICLGALTHVAWDAFTHEGGFFVERLALLRTTAFVLFGMDVPVYRVLQHASTVVGLAAIAATCGLWLRKARRAAPPLPRESDAWRYAVWTLLFTLPVVPAVPCAVWHSNFLPLASAVRIFVYEFVVAYIGVFFASLGVAALLFFFLGGRRFFRRPPWKPEKFAVAPPPFPLKVQW